jgi:hypothetical protein
MFVFQILNSYGDSMSVPAPIAYMSAKFGVESYLYGNLKREQSIQKAWAGFLLFASLLTGIPLLMYV